MKIIKHLNYFTLFKVGRKTLFLRYFGKNVFFFYQQIFTLLKIVEISTLKGYQFGVHISCLSPSFPP